MRSNTAFAAGNYQEEHVNFVLNRLFVVDAKKCAEDLVEKCRKNDFQEKRRVDSRFFKYREETPD